MPAKESLSSIMEDKLDFIKSKLKEELDNHKGPITLLFDFWSSISRQAYLGVTYSYIRNNQVIFCYFELDLCFSK